MSRLPIVAGAVRQRLTLFARPRPHVAVQLGEIPDQPQPRPSHLHGAVAATVRRKVAQMEDFGAA